MHEINRDLFCQSLHCDVCILHESWLILYHEHGNMCRYIYLDKLWWPYRSSISVVVGEAVKIWLNPGWWITLIQIRWKEIHLHVALAAKISIWTCWSMCEKKADPGKVTQVIQVSQATMVGKRYIYPMAFRIFQSDRTSIFQTKLSKQEVIFYPCLQKLHPGEIKCFFWRGWKKRTKTTDSGGAEHCVYQKKRSCQRWEITHKRTERCGFFYPGVGNSCH